jgi:hypothetical protein
MGKVAAFAFTIKKVSRSGLKKDREAEEKAKR